MFSQAGFCYFSWCFGLFGVRNCQGFAVISLAGWYCDVKYSWLVPVVSRVALAVCLACAYWPLSFLASSQALSAPLSVIW